MNPSPVTGHPSLEHYSWTKLHSRYIHTSQVLTHSSNYTSKAMYKRAIGGSLEDLTSLAEIDPGDPQYNSQIGRVFDVLLYRMNLSFQSPTTQIELFSLSTAYCCCLMNLRPSGDEVPDGLSKGFTRVWPAIWKVFGSTFVPSV